MCLISDSTWPPNATFPYTTSCHLKLTIAINNVSYAKESSEIVKLRKREPNVMWFNLDPVSTESDSVSL